ncbi:unnamed protein product [Lupinus luteus]|uniref:Uncharacterized protein n=1 Tax=Lupinus luteus TaxID=3873 RepID=A0AAV1X5W5_LUPLU
MGNYSFSHLPSSSQMPLFDTTSSTPLSAFNSPPYYQPTMPSQLEDDDDEDDDEDEEEQQLVRGGARHSKQTNQACPKKQRFMGMANTTWPGHMCQLTKQTSQACLTRPRLMGMANTTWSGHMRPGHIEQPPNILRQAPSILRQALSIMRQAPSIMRQAPSIVKPGAPTTCISASGAPSISATVQWKCFTRQSALIQFLRPSYSSKDPKLQLKSLRQLELFTAKNEPNKKCLLGIGVPKAVLVFVVDCFRKGKIDDGVEDALSLHQFVKVPEQDVQLLLVENDQNIGLSNMSLRLWWNGKFYYCQNTCCFEE